MRKNTDFVLCHPWETEDGINSDFSLVKLGLKRSVLRQCLPTHNLFKEQGEFCGSFAPLQRLSTRSHKTEGFPGITHVRVAQKSLSYQVGFGTRVHQNGNRFSGAATGNHADFHQKLQMFANLAYLVHLVRRDFVEEPFGNLCVYRIVRGRSNLFPHVCTAIFRSL